MKHLLQIGSKASPHSALFRWGVHTDENEVGFPDALVDICGEEQIAPAADLDDLDETRFIDWQAEVRAVPRVNTRLIQIDDGHFDCGALERDDSASGTACDSS